MKRYLTVDERFAACVPTPGPLPTPCLIWPWRKDHRGYGRFGRDGRQMLAHRASWEHANGPIPPGTGYHGTCVLHACDTPACVNPKHLFLGTAGDNSRDMARKGRAASGDRNGARLYPERLPRGETHPHRSNPTKVVRGEKSGMSTLTSEQVTAIREEYAREGVSQDALARKYGVAQTNISSVVRRATWAHVP